jgi:hypothetical protein
MRPYHVTLRLSDGTSFTWKGPAKSQYRAELLAVAELRKTSALAIIQITTEETA